MTQDAATQPSDTENARIVLPPRLDLSVARDLAADILDYEGQSITLDASEVQHLGGLGLQLLMVARDRWKESNLNLDVRPRSPEFEKNLAELGVSLDRITTGECV